MVVYERNPGSQEVADAAPPLFMVAAIQKVLKTFSAREAWLEVLNALEGSFKKSYRGAKN